MMVARKIYMLAFSIYLTLSVIAQYILIIVDILFFKMKNNYINNTQPQIGVYQESEREANNKQNNENGEFKFMLFIMLLALNSFQQKKIRLIKNISFIFEFY